MEELNKNEIEEKEKQENVEQKENMKVKLGTVGNFVLLLFVVFFFNYDILL